MAQPQRWCLWVKWLHSYWEHCRLRIAIISGLCRIEKWALRIHRDDLLDMLGNVLKNACKYGAGRVRNYLGQRRGQRFAHSR